METIERPAGQTIILCGVIWETYEALLVNQQRPQRATLCLRPGRAGDNESVIRTRVGQPRSCAAGRSDGKEFDIDARDLGSNTFKREELERGFEPDSCFYIRNEERVRGKDLINLVTDPPPDLVIDTTSPSLHKLPIYARLGVPEIWRYAGTRMAILRFEETGYVEVDERTVLPLTGAVLSSFVAGQIHEAYGVFEGSPRVVAGTSVGNSLDRFYLRKVSPRQGSVPQSMSSARVGSRPPTMCRYGALVHFFAGNE